MLNLSTFATVKLSPLLDNFQVQLFIYLILLMFLYVSLNYQLVNCTRMFEYYL